MILRVVGNSIYAEIIRAVTGRLFTEEQIAQITSHALRRYLSDFLPEPGYAKSARERVEEARSHIVEASEIISGMQADLEVQTAHLDSLLADIEEKKQLAERYRILAETNQEGFAALKEEMGAALRNELTLQSEQGKNRRRIASFLIWIFTLILGAALGTYFPIIVSWGSGLMKTWGMP